MWWLPLISAFLLAGLLYILQLIQRNQQASRFDRYRSDYLTLVRRTESVTGRFNKVAGAMDGRVSKEWLDYYEASLRLLENLLTMFKELEPFGQDLEVLNSAHFLLKDCQTRLDRIEQALKQMLKGRAVDQRKLYGWARQKVPIGCYFCSRPFLYARFKQVKVRIDQKVSEVYSCEKCRSQLEKTGQVKVLYFLKDGKQVHWSELSDYNPVHDYWNVNRKTVLMKQTPLELVYSRKNDDPPVKR